MSVKATTKITVDVAPEIKEKAEALKENGETMKNLIVRLIENEYNKAEKQAK